MNHTANFTFRTKQEKTFLILLSLFFLLGILILPAQAHHPWDAAPQETFNIFQGFLSGLGHPILGIDHFLFLLSIGLIGCSSGDMKVPFLLSFGLCGSILSQFVPIFPGSEFLMALSLVLAALVAFSRLPSIVMLGLIFCHGFVLGKSMIGVEPTPLLGYFTGLMLVEMLIIFFGNYVFKHFLKYRHFFSLILLGAGLTLTTNTLFRIF